MTSPRSTRYSCDAKTCDVVNVEALVEYRAKRDQWLRWYEHSADEPNSIQQQLFSMIFIDLSYRIVVGPRGQSGQDIAANSLVLAHLIDQCYVANQVLAIRRLLDRRKDVISLRHLLDDISQHRALLTREIYVCYDGLPYNPESWQSIPATTETKLFGIQAPAARKHFNSLLRHQSFDRLSGVAENSRNRSDRIRDEIFQRLDDWIDGTPADTLVTLSHKFFAHAATADSRGTIAYSGIRLADIAAIHKAFIRVERALTDEILYIATGRDVVPMPPLGMFKGLDNPYVLPDAVEKMYEKWDELSAERNSWTKGITDDLTK